MSSISLRKKCTLTLAEVVTKENLYHAWNDFIRGKRKRPDVNAFALRLADNLSELYDDLMHGRYTHGLYEAYTIIDPKKRVIHKASVRDRVVHRLLYNALYSYFDTRFLHDSYSCRTGKGTHKARAQFRSHANRVSRNYTKQCFVLKFDIKKCFESVDKDRLKELLQRYIVDDRLHALLATVIDSFAKGLPLGNLTSQLFINIYLHELDYYAKHTLRMPHYIRYADDVVILHESPEYLQKVFEETKTFLASVLSLTTHKIRVQSIYSGVDVLGEVFFAKYKRLRRSTERRAKLRDGARVATDIVSKPP